MRQISNSALRCAEDAPGRIRQISDSRFADVRRIAIVVKSIGILKLEDSSNPDSQSTRG